VEKTLSLILIIGLGVALKAKIKSKDQLQGLKTLILSIALPATIFAALLSVEVDASMLVWPAVGLGLNLLMFAVFIFTTKWLEVSGRQRRTLLMLMPSLAPGLSCFPFIVEYMGEESLALAALADVGNKVFVLIILYLIAMHWYYGKVDQDVKRENRLKELVIAMVKEPINMVIVVALLLLAFGVTLSSMPTAIGTLILRLGAIMAPLVLLFIGMAVRIKRDDIGLIMRVLALRSAVGFFLVSGVMLFFPGLGVSVLLLLLVFSQSSASFWPFAHISAVGELESSSDNKTFDTGLALSVLAISLPFSTFIILAIFSFPSVLSTSTYPLSIGMVLTFLFLAKPLFVKVKFPKSLKDKEPEIQGHRLATSNQEQFSE